MFNFSKIWGLSIVGDLHIGASVRGPSFSRFVLLLGLVSFLHLLLVFLIPLTNDELYYWSWSQNLSLSYFDHPPLTAWATRLSTALFGSNPFGIRLPAIICSTATVFLLSTFAAESAMLSALLFTPVFFFGSVLLTPDQFLVFFWALYMMWTVHIHTQLEAWNGDPVTRVYHHTPISFGSWIVGGTLMGLGLLSKYTMLLALACSLVTFISRTELRPWWRGYLWHLVWATFIASPVLIFNWQHQFQPLLFQWHHIQNYVSTGQSLWLFWASQALLIGWIPVLFLPRILLHWGYLWRDPKIQPCLVFFLVPFCFFFYKTLTGYLDSNWALAAYVSVWPVAQRICAISSFRHLNAVWIVVGFLPAWIATAALCTHFVRPLPYLPLKDDRLRMISGRLNTTQRAAAFFLQNGIKDPLFLATYQWTAVFKYHFRNTSYRAEQLSSARASQYTLSPDQPCRYSAVYYWMPLPSELPTELACFTKTSSVQRFYVEALNKTVETYELLKLEK